jgi:excisionase family DNA binding protein
VLFDIDKGYVDRLGKGMMEGKIIEISGRRFVSAATLAGLLDLHKRTILMWTTEYGIPVIAVGNMRLFDLADISDWLDNHKR